jgi:hypothetical protein
MHAKFRDGRDSVTITVNRVAPKPSVQDQLEPLRKIASRDSAKRRAIAEFAKGHTAERESGGLVIYRDGDSPGLPFLSKANRTLVTRFTGPGFYADQVGDTLRIFEIADENGQPPVQDQDNVDNATYDRSTVEGAHTAGEKRDAIRSLNARNAAFWNSRK